MAGSISLSLSQQFDELGSPLSGGRLYFIQAGTTSTPQNAYYDPALTLPLPNPYTLNAAGRITAFYLADGQIKIRLTSATGVVQIEQDNLLVIGPSSGGGGGGGGVDPTTIIATGDIKTRYGTGSLTGFVRLNGRTIGSATSGATERSNSDAQALFEYLWLADANLAVSTGRGLTANADWVANKTIALPDFRSRSLSGLGDMGNSDNALFSGVTFTSGNATTLGALLGAARRTLDVTQLPTVTPAGTIVNVVTNAAHDSSSANTTSGTGGAASPDSNTLTRTNTIVSSTFTGTPFGGGQAHDTVSPVGLITIYCKL